MVNTFVDIFLGSDIGYFSGKWGIYEKHWEFGPNGEIVRLLKSVSDDGKRTYYPGNRPTSVIAGTQWSHVVRGYIAEGEPAESTASRNAYYKRYNAYYDEAIANDYWYQVPDVTWKDPTSETFDKIGADLKRIFREVFASVTVGNMTAEDGIATYKKQLRDIGAQNMLDEANAYIGKTSSSVYRY